MCKILIIPNASKIDCMTKFSKAASHWLKDMRDGYGWIALGDQGAFGERTTTPDLYRDVPKHGERMPYAKIPSAELQFFGKPSKVQGAAMFHGRVSTNDHNMLNTHPIEREGYYIIHNGVVTHHGETYLMNTTNDTEHVLFNFIQGGIDNVAKNLTGYYATGIIDPNGQLHVMRDAIASLHVAWSDTLNSPIFATTSDIIKQVGKYLNESLDIHAVTENSYMVFNRSGELTEHSKFKSRGYDSYSASLSSKSLGKSLTWSDTASYSWRDDDTYFDADSFEVYDLVSDDFLDEIERLDDSYTILDRHGVELTVKQFEQLRLVDQANCLIERQDGSFLDPYQSLKNKNKRYK